MRRLAGLLLLSAVAVAQPADAPLAPASAYDADALDALIDARIAARLDRNKPDAGWKDGFFIQSSDGKTKVKIGAFTQFDSRVFIEDSAKAKTDQFNFRSIRPDLQATFLDHFDVRLMPDFAGAKLVVQDAYVDVHYADVVKVRFGKFKVPFGLERLQGEANTLFAERGLPTQIAPNRDLGVQVFGEIAGGTLAYQLGVFNGVADGASGDGDVSDGKEGAARIFIKPFAQTKDRWLAELGFGGAVTFGQKNGTLASPDVPIFKTQASTSFFSLATGTALADTVIADGHQWRASGQASYYAGPLGILGEYVRSAEHLALGPSTATLTTDAFQGAVQYVLTGDNATYKSVAPDRPLDPSKGHYGAFDIAARFNELRIVDTDLFRLGFADATKSAFRVRSGGLGLNWYATRFFRVAIDYERTYFRSGARDAGAPADRPAESSFVGRVQTAF
ncbi:MAG TPA: porin [Kofleriaceae bacterium]